MKSFIALLIALCFISTSASSQVLFSENFVYTGTNGDSLTNPSIGGNIWKAHSGGGNLIRNVKFQTTGLSFSGYKGSGLGGSVKFQTTVGSQDVNANIGSNVNTGSVYASFLLRIDSSGGKDTATDYFFHLCDSSGITGVSNFRARVFVADGSTTNTFKIGLSKGTGAKLTANQITAGAKAPVFTTTEYNVGQTYLVVLKYTFNTSSTRDDNLDLFVIDAAIPASLPTPTLSFTDTAISDLKQIQSVVIRQGNIGRTLGILDGIYSYSSWSDIISTGANYIITSTAGSNGSITPSGAVSVASGTNQTFSITPNSGYSIQDVLVDGSSQGAITTYTFNNVTTTHTINASFQAIVAQPTLVDEDFTYTGNNGDSLTSPLIGGALWKTHSGGGSLAKNIQFQNASLSYVGYKGSGLGGSVTFQNTVRSQDVNAYIGSNNKTGSYYTSFLMKIDSSGGKDTATDYFYHLCDTNGVNGVANFRARVFVADGSTANTFRIGLSKGTGAKLTPAQITAGAKVPVFTTTEYNIGQTYLVVMKYTFNATTTKDDNLDLFVMNTAIPTTEPSATLSFTDTAVSDLKQLQSVVIRQGSTGRTAGTIDGIKFYSQWSSIIASGTTYTITASAGANGSISPNGAVPVSSGSTQKFNITPNTGYIIQDVLVDGTSVGAVASYTFNTVTVNHTISASFAVNTTTYTITATAGANGSITPSGAVVVTSGTNQTFNIIANSGYAVQDVLVDGVSVGAVSSYTFNNVIAAHTISASFKTVITSGVLFEENFVYQGANGDSLNNPSIGGNIWKAHSGGGSAAKNIQFQNSSLSFINYAGSGLGGSVTFQNNVRNQDVNAKLPNNISSGSLYSSFLLKIDSSGGKDTATDYFYHFCDTSGLTGVSNFRSRIFVADGSTANTFKIGLAKGTGAKLTPAQINAGAKTPKFTTTEFNVGQTYLVVLKYVFNGSSTRDDSMHLFILDASIPTSEPLPAVSFADTAISDLKQIQSVVMREGSTGRTLGAIDGIKVFTNWADLLPVASTYSIAGSISLPNNKKVNKANITLKGTTTTGGQSDASGVYSFSNLATGNYVLKPAKNNDVTKANGVTSIDALLTQRHILNTTKFNSPYKLIAADVTGDKQINSVDVLRIKRLILGTDTTFTSTTKGSRLWEFIDSAYVFPDTTNPFPFKDSILFTNLTSNKTNQTFVGVKLGDVNYDWNPAVARQSVKSLELIVDRKEQASTTRYTLSAINFKDLAAMQYTLHFDNTKYEFIGIENNKLGIDFSDIQATATGNIAMLWTDKNAEAKTLEDGSELFTLVLRAKELGVSNLELGINNDIAEVEAWDSDYKKHNVTLTQKVSSKDQEPKTKDQLVIYPNPTNGFINIECANSKQIVIIDAMGRIVKQFNNATKRLTFNCKLLTKGIYMIQATMQDGTVNAEKLVVE
ncbi:MAG: dockerin type I domain-containing protein [Bacteroidetes bacterium]|nr:dockerin type I domain-containing protein [Bacteroidota bacterium]